LLAGFKANCADYLGNRPLVPFLTADTPCILATEWLGKSDRRPQESERMRAALEKRAASRKKMVLPLKSSTLSTPAISSIAVHTLDLSRSGAKLGAFRGQVKRGDVLLVQRQHKRAKCRVIWVREIEPGEVHVGIEFLGSEDGFWGVPLEDERAGVWTIASERW
jgi:hypothetical protein